MYCLRTVEYKMRCSVCERITWNKKYSALHLAGKIFACSEHQFKKNKIFAFREFESLEGYLFLNNTGVSENKQIKD